MFICQLSCRSLHLSVYPTQVLDLLEEQLQRVDQRIDALLLVGGFSGSEYLFKRVDVCTYRRLCDYIFLREALGFRNNLELELRLLHGLPMRTPLHVAEQHNTVSHGDL